MPDKPSYLKRDHPGKASGHVPLSAERRHWRPSAGYAELCCKSNFSFLRGASHPEELTERAAALGYTALAITDRHTLAGVVRMHCAAKACGLKLIVGAELVPVDAPPVMLYATDRAAYGRLCRIITRGRLRSPKGACEVYLADIAEWCEGLVAVVGGEKGRRDGGTEGRRDDGAERRKRELAHYRDIFGDRLYVAAGVHGGAGDEGRLGEIATLARAVGVPMVATNDVHYHEPGRRFLQDVLTCVRQRCTLEDVGRRLFANAERHLKPVEAMRRLFVDYPDAIVRTVEVAERCHFSLDELRYEYPEALCPPGRQPGEYLAALTWAGAAGRYPGGVPDKVRGLIEHELSLIGQLAYEPYFLTVWDIVRFARSRDILCQGRGSAANSAVCYCLGITSVDPDRAELLFERFVSAERNEPPDIDVDFEHERREEVFQYIYGKYGREHAGIVGEVISYRPRSAIRDVGKALGLSLDLIDALAKKHEWWDQEMMPQDLLREVGLDPSDRTLCMLQRLVRQLVGFPRHLSQHVGGFVITRGPLCEMVPIENAVMPDRTFIEWDKDDIDALGILKIDCLALGMLTAIGRCLKYVRRDGGTKGLRDGGGRGQDTTGIKGVRYERVADGKESCANQDVSRSDCVAEGDGVGETGLPSCQRHARGGAVRPDVANAQSGGVGAIQYCRGVRTRKSYGIRPLSAHRPWVADGVADASPPGGAADIDQSVGSMQGAVDGDRSCSTRPHSQHSTPAEVKFPGVESCTHAPPPPSSLRPFVPSSLHQIPPEDPVVYDMICHADTVGVFQIESRAQMSMLPRLKPRCFYDLVIEVAIVRPGPIQGGMVHPYLRRRDGTEPVTYPNEAIKQVLERTLGVPLFQEQAMRLAVVAADFTPGEADQLRRAMGAWRRSGDINRFQVKLIEGMTRNGLSEEFAKRCFDQICGFGEYGFPESHAASFALLVYVSCWLKRYYPAAFCAALINSQPMGFYHPAQLVRDAREHGVPVRPVDVNVSGFDCRLEGRSDEAIPKASGQAARRSDEERAPEHWGGGGPAVRLGMRLVKGVSRAQVEGIERAQGERPFVSMADLVHRSGASLATLARLAAADAMRSLGLGRREAVWQVLAMGDDQPLWAGQDPIEPKATLPAPSLEEVVLADYETVGLSLTAHPIALVRDALARLRVSPAKALKNARNGQWLKVAGLVLVRQRPSTAKGIVFCTLEDETGVANLIIPPDVYHRYRAVAHGSVALVAEGKAERLGEVVHLKVTRVADLTKRPVVRRSVSRDFR